MSVPVSRDVFGEGFEDLLVTRGIGAVEHHHPHGRLRHEEFLEAAVNLFLRPPLAFGGQDGLTKKILGVVVQAGGRRRDEYAPRPRLDYATCRGSDVNDTSSLTWSNGTLGTSEPRAPSFNSTSP